MPLEMSMGGKGGKRKAQCNPYGWEVEWREGGERGGVREGRGERGEESQLPGHLHMCTQ